MFRTNLLTSDEFRCCFETMFKSFVQFHIHLPQYKNVINISEQIGLILSNWRLSTNKLL